MPLYDGITTRLLDDYQTQLVIEKISSRHNGDYTCLASNSAATRSYTATLTVNGKAPAAGAAGGGAGEVPGRKGRRESVLKGWVLQWARGTGNPRRGKAGGAAPSGFRNVWVFLLIPLSVYSLFSFSFVSHAGVPAIARATLMSLASPSAAPLGDGAAGHGRRAGHHRHPQLPGRRLPDALRHVEEGHG